QAKALESGFIFVTGRKEEHRYIPNVPEFSEKRKPVSIRKHHIQQHCIRRCAAKTLQSLGAGKSRICLITLLSQNILYHFLKSRFIIHNENTVSHGTFLLCVQLSPL